MPNPDTTYKTTLASQFSKILGSGDHKRSDAYIIYITGDRQPVQSFGTQLHPEVVPLFYEHLKKIGKVNKISVILYTAGGALETPWPLVNIIKEFCTLLEVVVPYKALSAGTLMSLGADNIVTTPLSLFSPVDPTGNFIIGNQKKSIQVEDIAGYIDFAKSKIGLKSQAVLIEVLKSLSTETPPSIIGNINRTHSLIRQLVDKMLDLHRVSVPEAQRALIKRTLTEKLYSHQHLINRKEMIQIGFSGMVEEASQDLEVAILDIYKHFAKVMKLEDKFDPESELTAGSNHAEFDLSRAIIASDKLIHSFDSKYLIDKQEVPSQGKPTIFLNVKDYGWQRRDI